MKREGDYRHGRKPDKHAWNEWRLHVRKGIVEEIVRAEDVSAT